MDELWNFQIAEPALVHKGTNDGTVPVCLAAKHEYGIGNIGKALFVCGPDDIPDQKKFIGYAGWAWCPECESTLAYMKTSEFANFLKNRRPTIPLIYIGRF